MTALHITPCEPADYDAIDRLTARAYAPSGFTADDPYFIEILNVAQRAQQALVLVARQNGVPVGTLTCALPGSSWQEIARADEAELRILAVAPDPKLRSRAVSGTLRGEKLKFAAIKRLKFAPYEIFFKLSLLLIRHIKSAATALS